MQPGTGDGRKTKEEMKTLEVEIGGKTISLETGRLAKQASGAVLVRCGDTVVLVTATVRDETREGQDFFPLTVDVEERIYAAGKIPGGFIKRESRPSEKAILAARQIDRPIRPLFPKGFMNEVQVVAHDVVGRPRERARRARHARRLRGPDDLRDPLRRAGRRGAHGAHRRRVRRQPDDDADPGRVHARPRRQRHA